MGCCIVIDGLFVSMHRDVCMCVKACALLVPLYLYFLLSPNTHSSTATATTTNNSVTRNINKIKLNHSVIISCSLIYWMIDRKGRKEIDGKLTDKNRGLSRAKILQTHCLLPLNIL